MKTKGRAMNVLVADDQIGILESLTLLIEEKGHNVDLVSDGKKALDMIIKNDYDLAFIDHSMPGLSGLELIQYIKKHNIKITTVMITGDKGMKAILARSYGAQEYIEKPFEVKQIDDILTKYAK